MKRDKMNKLKNILSWIALLVYLILIFAFVADKKDNVICSSLEVNILDSLSNCFIDKEDVRVLITKENDNILGYPLVEINFDKLERKINRHPVIKSAEVYVTMDGCLHIDILQRKPIMRIINKYDQSIYIDYEGEIMPLSSKYTSHVLIANGNITYNFNTKTNTNITLLKDSENPDARMLAMLFDFGRYVFENRFWRAQIEQVYLDENGDFEIIPRVGSHIITLGSLDNYREKLNDLKVLYKEGFNNIGWNEYDKINLKFNGQIICTKRY